MREENVKERERTDYFLDENDTNESEV